MKQPKFKFGDKVSLPDCQVFTITSIALYDGEFVYSGGCEKGTYKSSFGENHLQLYQEPKKKMLYAYWIKAQVLAGDYAIACVVFHDDEKYCNSSGLMTRASEYDIEYPETKVV